MSTIQFITFLIIFTILILIINIKCKKIDKAIEDIDEKIKRKALEAENTEFDYGHNVTHKSEE